MHCSQIERSSDPSYVISNYSAYIQSYVLGKGRTTLPSPGEHHFVSTYLVPKLYSINGKVPDYVNPDGTKAILGDIVYYQDGKHHFGIEVKLGVIRLTKREFNEWIVEDKLNRWPHLFIGVGHTGIGLATWQDFREVYVTAIRAKNSGWIPKRIADGYGPMKDVDVLLPTFGKSGWFPFSADALEASKNEARFTKLLRSHIQR